MFGTMLRQRGMKRAIFAVLFAIFAAVGVFIAIEGYLLSGDDRGAGADALRRHDIEEIRENVAIHYDAFGALPPLISLLASTTGFVVPDGPGGVPYTYERRGQSEYRLCAVFSEAYASPRAGESHSAGRYCFDFDARSDRSSSTIPPVI